jgi:hypothetical protein
MAEEEKPVGEKSETSTSKSVTNLVAVIGAITALVAAIAGLVSALKPKEEVTNLTRLEASDVNAALPNQAPANGQPPADGAARQADAIRVARLLWRGQFDAIRVEFADGLSANLSASQMQQSREKVITPLGGLQSVTPQPPFAINGRTVVNVKCVGEHGTLILQLAYDSSGKIVGLWRHRVPN